MKKTKLTIEEQAEKILAAAEERGLESNFFFVTTFRRYQTQIKLLADLEKAIDEDGTTVEKEYVKGRKNIYTNPAITEYNKTCTAANHTVATLMKIITTLTKDDSESDPLMSFLKK